jgi:hypothetical protein
MSVLTILGILLQGLWTDVLPGYEFSRVLHSQPDVALVWRFQEQFCVCRWIIGGFAAAGAVTFAIWVRLAPWLLTLHGHRWYRVVTMCQWIPPPSFMLMNSLACMRSCVVADGTVCACAARRSGSPVSAHSRSRRRPLRPMRARWTARACRSYRSHTFPASAPADACEMPLPGLPKPRAHPLVLAVHAFSRSPVCLGLRTIAAWHASAGLWPRALV